MTTNDLDSDGSRGDPNPAESGSPIPSDATGNPSKASVEYLQSQRVAANFGNIVTILMQSPVHAGYELKDLHRLVVPAVVNNQFRLAEAHKKGSGFTVPVAVVLWARVSPAVADKLSDATQEHILLEREDWTSGDEHWIIEVVGEDRFVGPLLKTLLDSDLQNKSLKYRQRTQNGIEIKTLAGASTDT